MKHLTLLSASFLGFVLNITVAHAEGINVDNLEEERVPNSPYVEQTNSDDLAKDDNASRYTKDSSKISEDYNPNSIYPIPYTEILMRRRMWIEIDLREKYNKPFFPRNKELTKFIIEGVKSGLLTPYNDEEFLEPMTKEEFLENLKIPDAYDFSGTDDGWGDSPQKATSKQESEGDYFFPHEVAILELMEDWIFHKVSSTQIHDIQSIKLIIPEDKFETGLRKDVAIFKYKDLAIYFDEQGLVWHNVNNRAADIKLTEAFEQRLFTSRIVKLENPDDNTIADIYNKNPKDAAKASKELAEKMLRQEQFLWEP